MTWLLVWTFAKRPLGAALNWIAHTSFWQLVSLGLAILAIVQHFQTIEARHDAAKWQRQFTAEHNARLADHQAYAKAQADATAENKAQVQQVEQHYQRNSDNERQAYLSDLAKLRARRLRPQAATNPGAPRSAGPSAPSGSAPRIDEAGLCVPATSDVCEAGAEIELRLMHLQNLFEQQSNIDPNK